jgi:hypothetical protein
VVVCPCCQRHVKESEARCPFCRCEEPARRRGASYLALAALSAGMAATQGCYGGPPTPRDDIGRPRQPVEQRADEAPVESTERPR